MTIACAQCNLTSSKKKDNFGRTMANQDIPNIYGPKGSLPCPQQPTTGQINLIYSPTPFI
jgi:hypothetical protein